MDNGVVQPIDPSTNNIVHADNLDALAAIPDESFDLVYIDPPFNTGKVRRHATQVASPDPDGLQGFGGRSYSLTPGEHKEYDDRHADFLAFLRPRVAEARRVLKPDGSLFFHIDPRESHYCKVMLDDVFGRASFLNEIVWAYDYGGRPKTRWPAKHDVLFWYAKDPSNYVFRYDQIDRIPYMAPNLVGQEKAARGKTPTDVWWNTIVPTSGKEKTGYPTQKPLAILERIVRVHTGDQARVLDFFAGSGTTGEAAAKLGRKFTLIDANPQAIDVMRKRLAKYL